ncbi:hypothetical protein C1X99_30655, partial [Pseudomonas sp. FW306-02-H06B]
PDQVIGGATLVFDPIVGVRAVRASEVDVGRFGAAPGARERFGEGDALLAAPRVVASAEVERHAVERCGLIERERVERALRGAHGV